jgi:hypothetical protein
MKRILAVLVLAVLVTGCSSGADDAGTATAGSATTQVPATTGAAANGQVDALFDVGGHKLHLTCEGTGSPTVVYLHGLDLAGSSDKVPGPLNGKTSVADLHRLLRAAKVEPPYVLLGPHSEG